MKVFSSIGLPEVQAVYSSAEADLWKLVMGEQIHIGGLESSLELAERAGIQPGSSGIDLCCCLGAGMRFLARFRKVGQMTGIDATPRMIERGQMICQEEGLADRIRFVQADVTASGQPDASADFIWGEDAWCYVVDKRKLIAEATRLVRPGGTIAFTDWVEGPAGLTVAEAQRFMKFMKFPSLPDIPAYSQLLVSNGCKVTVAADTGRFPHHVDLYLNMLSTQLRYDALKIVGFNQEVFQSLAGEMIFIQRLAHARKIVQAMFVARRNGDAASAVVDV